jgi:hypothetical protein
VHVLVQAAHHEHLVVVVHGVGAEKLFRLLKRTVLTLNLIRLSIEAETVRDPPVISPKDKNLVLTPRKAAHGVSRRPQVVFIAQHDHLPFLIF